MSIFRCGVGRRRRGSILMEFLLVTTLLGLPLLIFMVDAGHYFKVSSGLNRTANIIADIVSRGVSFDLCSLDRLLAFELHGAASGRLRENTNDFRVVISEVEIYDEHKDNPPQITQQHSRGLLSAESKVGDGVGSRAQLGRELNRLQTRLTQIAGGRPVTQAATDNPLQLIAVEIWVRFAPLSQFLDIFPHNLYSDVAFRSYRLGSEGGMRIAEPTSSDNPAQCS
ncbi:MAG: hypothetical protein GDA50_04885 [Alphaproteobacteria bacterium GM202ARS2]|nr:hypothetical protein [Alphaproteobacteria bacterium GM202ARS2]